MTPTAAPPPEVRAFLDHASASPLRPEVASSLVELLGVVQADPGRPYDEAIVVRRLIEDARDAVAALAGTTSRQVVFTSGLAESATTAMAALAPGGVVLAAGVERSSVLDAARRYAAIEMIEVDHRGRLDLGQLADRLAKGGVSLVCGQVANHETGTRNDMASLVELTRAAGATSHVDASMGFGRLDMDLAALGADVVTVSAELLGAPMGAGALLVRKGRLLAPLLLGGAQERARRAGLENLLGIIGFGIAAELLVDQDLRSSEMARAARQIDALEAAATKVEGVTALGDPDPAGRVRWLRCFGIEGVEAEPVLMGLDRAGISVHSGSACSTESLEPSPVLAAMGLDADRSLRLSVGWSTTDADIQRFAECFGPVLGELRALRT